MTPSFSQVEAAVPGAIGSAAAVYYTTGSFVLAGGAFLGALFASLGYGGLAAHYAGQVQAAAAQLATSTAPKSP